MKYPCINIQELSFSYGEKNIFTQFCASIQTGTCTSIMAGSGVGKTTLLHLIAGLLRPASGSIQYPVQKPRFSLVFQENRLLSHSSLWKNLQIVNPNITREQACLALSEVGMPEELLSKRAGQLSGGEKRRAAILRALLSNYDILLLDEPFTGLDGSTKAQAIHYVKACTFGKTVLLVTHDQEESHALGCDDILRL